LKKDAEVLAAESYIDISYGMKNHHDYAVYLEQESTVEINTKDCNYAFCAGANGLGKLPVLLTLPRKRISFDLVAFERVLKSKKVFD